MPDLNLAALNIAPSTSPAPVRTNDGGPADEPAASSFDKVMTRAATSHAPSPGDSKTASTKPNESNDARPQRPSAHKEKAAKADEAKDRKKNHNTKPLVDPQAATTSITATTTPATTTAATPAVEPPAIDASLATAADAKGRELAANILSTLATPHPAAAALAHAAVRLPAAGGDSKVAQTEGDTAVAATDGKSAAHVHRGQPTGAAGEALPAQPLSADAPAAANAAPDASRGSESGRKSVPELVGHDGSNAKPVQSAIAGHEAAALRGSQATAARDRLIEDFQQRFDRALTLAPAAGASSPRSEDGLIHSAAAPAWAGVSPFSAPANNVMQIAIPTPLGSAAFIEDFSNRVSLLTRGRIHSAELSLTPADLGPVSVSIEVKGNDATLVFSAAHAATRTAIEDALPRLREMLDAQGLQLADARVGSQAGQNAARDGRQPQQPPANGTLGPIDAANASVAPLATAAVSVRSTRLIDVIA
jgi:flagellar hook-length control protein FliK